MKSLGGRGSALYEDRDKSFGSWFEARDVLIALDRASCDENMFMLANQVDGWEA